MGLISPILPTIGQPVSTEDPDILNTLTALVNLVNGSIDAANVTDGSLTATELASALLSIVGVTGGGVTRRGKSIIATTEARTNTAYGKLTTPDQVSGLALATDGYLVVSFQAVWQESVAGAARAAIFLGTDQLKIASVGGAAPRTQAAATNGAAANTDRLLTTAPTGLISEARSGADPAAYTGDVTTGQIAGLLGVQSGGNGATGLEWNGTVGTSGSTTHAGWAIIEAAAGTYDISVQVKASSGSVTMKNRRLRAWTLGF